MIKFPPPQGAGRLVFTNKREAKEMPNYVTSPTASDLRRAICCPSGVCIAPEACYALDRSRAYPVHIHEAAEAVAKLLCERWREADMAAGRSTWEAEDAGMIKFPSPRGVGKLVFTDKYDAKEMPNYVNAATAATAADMAAAKDAVEWAKRYREKWPNEDADDRAHNEVWR